MALRQKLVNLQTGRIMYKQPEYTCEFIFFRRLSTNLWRTEVFTEILSMYLPSPSTIMVATVAAPVIMMSVSTSAVVVTVAAPVTLVVIVVPAVAVLLMTARTWFVRIALASATTVHVGRVIPVGAVVVLPWAASARISTRRRLPRWRFGKATIQLLKLLHVELPHHVTHLQWRRS